MTAIRQEAIQMLEKVPEDKLSFIIQIMQGVNGLLGMSDAAIAEQGVRIRGQYKNFKAMDALQIATAVVKKCDMFLTNDKQLRQKKEIPCITMEDI